MYRNLTSRESTISVDSPKTPDTSVVDNTIYLFSNEENRALRLVLEEPRQHLEEEISRLRREEEELEELRRVLEEQEEEIRVLRRIAKADNIEHLFELVRSQDVNTIVNHVNNCVSDEDKSYYLFSTVTSEVPRVLFRLPSFLEEYDKDGDIKDKLIKIFPRIPQFLVSEL